MDSRISNEEGEAPFLQIHWVNHGHRIKNSLDAQDCATSSVNSTSMNSNTVWPGLNSNAVWLKIILCICMYHTRDFWSTTCCHVTDQQGIRIFSNRIMTSHQSMPHHRSMSRHQFVYVNNVVNNNVDSTVHVNSIVHVNSAIFLFMLLLRFSTVLSSKVMSVLLSDFSINLKWPWCP